MTWTLLLLYLSNTHREGEFSLLYCGKGFSLPIDWSRLRLQCLYVYEAPHLTIESFNIILEACPNLRQVTFTRVCSQLTTLRLVWQPVSLGCELRGHPTDCQNRAQQQLGGGNTLRFPLVPVNLCQGGVFWSNMKGNRGAGLGIKLGAIILHLYSLKCKFCCVISSRSLVSCDMFKCVIM